MIVPSSKRKEKVTVDNSFLELLEVSEENYFSEQGQHQIALP